VHVLVKYKLDLTFSFISHRRVQVSIKFFQFRFHLVLLLTVAKIDYKRGRKERFIKSINNFQLSRWLSDLFGCSV